MIKTKAAQLLPTFLTLSVSNLIRKSMEQLKVTVLFPLLT